MKLVSQIIVLAVVVFDLSGCSSDSEAQSIPPEAQFVPIYSGISTSTNVGQSKLAKVLSSQDDFAAEYADYVGAAAPVLDFNAGKVLLTDMGSRASGGYSITLVSIDVGSNTVVATIDLVAPGPRCMVTQALTHPFQFSYIPTRKEILLSERLTVTNCP